MLTRIVLLLCLAFGGWQSAFAGVVRIADGDCAGLVNAVNAAQTGSASTILLARNGTYSGCSLNLSAGNVSIDGQGASLQFFSACMQTGNAALTLRNMAISPASGNASPETLCEIPTGDIGIQFLAFPIVNRGTLILDTVTVQRSASSQPVLIESYGSLTLRNVTAVVADDRSSLIENSGTLEVYNSTFVDNAAPSPSVSRLISNRAFQGNAGSARFANSIFAGSGSPLCTAGAYESLGGNVAADTSCGLSSAAGDKIVANVSLGSLDDHGGLVPTQALNYDSPARGAGVPQYCEAADARGYTRSSQGCDAGAYEFGGGSGALTANGFNGFYYDPAANGHYVSLQRINDAGGIAIVWSTFDSNGNQAWVYGIGQLTDRHIHASMSQNIGGVLQPGAAPTGSTVRAWGAVDIDLTSCTIAQFSYQSSISGFGSGQFPLTRLAFVSDFGCSD